MWKSLKSVACSNVEAEEAKLGEGKSEASWVGEGADLGFLHAAGVDDVEESLELFEVGQVSPHDEDD